MFWDKDIPRRQTADAHGRQVEVTVIAGALDGLDALAPPPHSWAADPQSDVAIWSISLAHGAKWVVPAARAATTVQTLHQCAGPGVTVDGRRVPGPAAIRVRADRPVGLEANEGAVEILLLQGRPIGEPIAQHGPFVMNTRAE